jgi:hypothetical protein
MQQAMEIVWQGLSDHAVHAEQCGTSNIAGIVNTLFLSIIICAMAGHLQVQNEERALILEGQRLFNGDINKTINHVMINRVVPSHIHKLIKRWSGRGK